MIEYKMAPMRNITRESNTQWPLRETLPEDQLHNGPYEKRYQMISYTIASTKNIIKGSNTEGPLRDIIDRSNYTMASRRKIIDRLNTISVRSHRTNQ
jgi:hypothetical protein